MTKSKQRNKSIKIIFFWVIVSTLISGLSLTTFFYVFFSGRVYPNVYIGNTLVGGLTQKEAFEKTTSDFSIPIDASITIKVENSAEDVVIPLTAISTGADTSEALRRAYNIGREDDPKNNIVALLTLLSKPSTITPVIVFNEEKLSEYLNGLDAKIEDVATPYSIKLTGNQVSINPGKSGKELDRARLKLEIESQIRTGHFSAIPLPIKVIDETLSDSEVEKLRERALSYIGKVITLTYEKRNLKKSPQDMVALLGPNGFNEENLVVFFNEVSREVNREPQNPIFKIENEKVTDFSPALPGLSVNKDLLISELKSTLALLENTEETSAVIEIPTVTTPPANSNSDADSYGITELIGRGTSRFSGSIPSRVHNVALASSRINNTLVAPGNTFSFAAVIGDISKYTGYKEAYVIQSGRTVLGDGGGVCQVSTTLFRAALNAGLPIVERYAHAYRVGYYEQDSSPGIDATVYVPSVDFKFKNDTQHYILIQTKVDTKKMTAEYSIYGTSDGRVSKVTKPTITDQIAPPEDEYIDDPTLPAGKLNQVEHKAWGARVSFDYTVVRGDETLFQKKFVSVYRPWKAVFMRGTGPAQ